MSKELKIMAVVFLVIFGGLGFLIAKNNQVATTPVPRDQLITPTTYLRGSANAKVSLVEFGDFQCPACAAAYPIIEDLLGRYKDNPEVSFAVRHFPLVQHKNAILAGQAAEAAGAQGKFWEMYGLLYEKQKDWENSDKALDIFVGYANQLKLDSNRFKTEISGNKYRDIVLNDQQAGVALGVNSTPTFFLNGMKMTGVQDFDDLKSRIDSELAK